jgi:SAM-dependent methyltransferase
MDDYQASTYGDRIAEVYDQWLFQPLDTEATVNRLAELAGTGPVLELRIGTGRVALPLAARGMAVSGIDASESMIAKLRAKPGGVAIAVTMGDFADVGVKDGFSLVFVVFNTIFSLQTQGDQVRCFANVSKSLMSGDRFVVEAFVPDLTRFDRDQRVHAMDVDTRQVRLDVTRHDKAHQQLETAHLVIGETGNQMYPVRARYAYPSEFDLMARLAGLELEERWGGWHRQEFNSESAQHVSVYRKPE